MAQTPAPSSIQDQATKLGLGVAAVTPALVSTMPTDIVPLKVIEARQLVPYRYDEATQTVFVAVADPAQLKVAAPAELQARCLRIYSHRFEFALVKLMLPRLLSRFSHRSRQTTTRRHLR
jgi:hypothetical protein